MSSKFTESQTESDSHTWIRQFLLADRKHETPFSHIQRPNPAKCAKALCLPSNALQEAVVLGGVWGGGGGVGGTTINPYNLGISM